jgi:hypothetical protein
MNLGGLNDPNRRI